MSPSHGLITTAATLQPETVLSQRFPTEEVDGQISVEGAARDSYAFPRWWCAKSQDQPLDDPTLAATAL